MVTPTRVHHPVGHRVCQLSEDPPDRLYNSFNIGITEPNPAWQAQALLEEPVGDSIQVRLVVAEHGLLVHGFPDRSGLNVLRLQRFPDTV